MKYLNPSRKIKFTKKLIFNLLITGLLIYFIFHSIYGNLGIISYFKLSQQLEKYTEELENLRIERIEVEHITKLLKQGDRDLVDEKARNILGVAAPKEQVFTVKEKSN